jgi:hypothetical protein
MKIQDFLNEKGRVSSTKTTEKYVSKKFPSEINLIIQKSIDLNIEDRSFSEKLHHYILDIDKKVMCLNCGEKATKFHGLSKGYREYCSLKCSNGSDSVKKLKEQAYISKFGVDNPSKSKEVKKKIENSFIERYGANPFAIKSVRERIKKTNIEKYGSEHPLSSNSTLREKIYSDNLEKFIKKYGTFKVKKYDTFKDGNATLECKVCQTDFEISKWNLHQRTKYNYTASPCTKCNPIGSASSTHPENFIRDFLDSAGVNYLERDRKSLKTGKEIDFFLPELGIGIETNGLYWHSDLFKEPSYHYDKMKSAEEQNIKLINIFEDEINLKPELVKGRLMSIMGINKERIYSRKCKIAEVDKKEASLFLSNNHMQGSCGSSVRMGLYFKGELVSIMTFGGLRKNMGSSKKESHWELIRFCNKIGYNVPGGGSRLLKKFIEIYSPKKIISYCDMRWSDGDFYKKIGFEFDGESKPNYWYFKNSRGRENRFNYRKDVLVKQGFPKEKSESSIMKERGFARIYDCGSMRFVMNLDII